MGVILTAYKSWDDPPRRNCVFASIFVYPVTWGTGCFPTYQRSGTRHGCSTSFGCRAKNHAPKDPHLKDIIIRQMPGASWTCKRCTLAAFCFLFGRNFMWFLWFFEMKSQQKPSKNMPQNPKIPTKSLATCLKISLKWTRTNASDSRCADTVYNKDALMQAKSLNLSQLDSEKVEGMKVKLRFYLGEVVENSTKWMVNGL